MFSTITFVAACLAGIAHAAPAPTLRERSSETCQQYGEIQTGVYTIYNDLWGESGASGSQCTTFNSLSGTTLQWSTTWTWAGGSGIKSFANAGYSFTSTQLSQVSSIYTTWEWTYSGNNIVADVAYDTFTSSTAGGNDEYEVMVWMAAIGGAGPISSQYSSSGAAKPIASPYIAGYEWDLYEGPHGDTTVFSFLPANGATISYFSGNIMAFYTYLIDNEGVSSNQYLTTLEAGTEATTGSNAEFTVSDYTIALTT